MEQLLGWIELLTGYTPVDLVISCVTHCRESREAAMTDKAYVVHRIPGRIRLRMPGRQYDANFFRDVETRLAQCPSVQQVKANQNTGSVLVHYTGELPMLLAEAMGAGLGDLAIEAGLPPLEPIGGRLRGRLGDLSEKVSRSTNGVVDGPGAVVIGLLLAGTLQALRGQVLGPAVPLLWYAAQAVYGMMPDRASTN